MAPDPAVVPHDDSDHDGSAEAELGPRPPLIESTVRWGWHRWREQVDWFRRRWRLWAARGARALAAWFMGVRQHDEGANEVEETGAPSRYIVAKVFRAWRLVALHGAFRGPDVLDSEEAVFEDLDPTPKERDVKRHGLRSFLMSGQDAWSKDGGVKLREPVVDPAMESILAMVERARRRRPKQVIQRFEDCLAHVGSFWSMDDFEGLTPELKSLLEEAKVAEGAQIAAMRALGEHQGFSIRREGCERLEIGADRTRDWCEGVAFDVDPEVPRYSKGPYPNVYQSVETVAVACREINKLLRWLIPVTAIPWIESRTQVVTKFSEWEEGGVKYRTVVDMTDSGLNDAVRLWKVALTTALECISKMGPGGLIFKADMADCFYHWKVRPDLWTFLGIRHPLTGQSYVFPVLPMGFSLSPPLCCTFTQEVAALIEGEMRARWEGVASVRKAFEAVPRRAVRRGGVEPGSEVYVDDFIHAIADGEWFEELVRVSEFVFETLGLVEKKKKREGPAEELSVLGFLFNTVTRILKIPDDKLRELRVQLASVLGRADQQQSVSHHELGSLVGKLQWGCSALVLGRGYLRHVRKPLAATLSLLRRRRDRERFCIPLYHFPKAVLELQWFEAALEAGGGSQPFHVGRDGKFEIWRWSGGFGDTVPEGVIQFASDASKIGGGFWFLQERRTRAWTRAEIEEHINILECLMILHALEEMGASWKGFRVLGWCDNSTTVQAVNKGRSRSNKIMQIVCRIRLLCVRWGIHLWLAHIPGVENDVADGLSRGLLARRVRDWSLGEENMARWSKLVGGFTVDAYANPSGNNAQADRFRSAVGGHTDFTGKVVWSFPPPELAEEMVKEAEQWGAARVLALVPRSTPRGHRWHTVGGYACTARVFYRWEREERVVCRAPGMAWDVISLVGAGRS